MALLPPPKELNAPLKVPHKLLMGPGPSNASPRILQALSQPVLGHMHPELFKIMDHIKKGIQYLFQTTNELTLALSASGHAGMECVMSNLLEPGDKVLIPVNGIWGERASSMARRQGAEVVNIHKTADAFSIIELENAVRNHRPKMLFLVQGESSSGVYQSLVGIGEVTRRYNCLLAVDTVASLGAVPFHMDLWKIDAVYTGCQKIIGVPPGLSPLSFSYKALQVILARKTPVPVYYWDLTLLGQQWGCFGNKPRLYHHTTSANLLYALREGLAILAEEQLENVVERHQKCALQLYEGLEALGLEFYVPDDLKRLPSVTTVKIPAGVDWRQLLQFAMDKYGLEISGGLGPTVGQVWRIGIMGYNATRENVEFTLHVLQEGLNTIRTKSKL